MKDFDKGSYDIESLMWGLRDTMASRELTLSQDEIEQVMKSFQQRMVARRAAQAAKNLADHRPDMARPLASQGFGGACFAGGPNGGHGEHCVLKYANALRA